MEITHRRAMLLLSIIVLGVYYPAVFADVNSLDDDLMLDQVSSLGISDIPKLFITTGAYYRPLVMASYVIDNRLFNQIEPIIHFENICIHLLNVLLVYLLASKLFSGAYTRFKAFISALLFAVNPLATESVAWISGRTDLLCSFFVLLAFLLVNKGIKEHKTVWSVLAAIFLFMGCLVKELAFFSVPALMIFTVYQDTARCSDFEWKSTRLLRIWHHQLPFIIIAVIYLIIRTLLAPNNFIKYAVNIEYASSTTDETFVLLEILRYFGFYLKKLVFPYPLNFAITNVYDTYIWIGLISLFVVAWLISLGRVYSISLAVVAFLLISAVYVALKNVAWTPAAERYLYLATAFWFIGLVDAVRLHLTSLVTKNYFQLIAFTLIATVTLTTVERLKIWQNNQSLYEDTLKKAPDFGPIRNQLAIALVEKNRYDEALAQIELGKDKKRQGDKVLLYINQALIEAQKKNYEKSVEILKSTSNGPNMAHPEVLKALINVTERRLVYDKSINPKKIRTELMVLHEIHYKRTGNTLHLYRSGQLALSLNNIEKAFNSFSTVSTYAPNDAYYKEAAKRLSGKLSVTKSQKTLGE